MNELITIIGVFACLTVLVILLRTIADSGDDEDDTD